MPKISSLQSLQLTITLTEIRHAENQAALKSQFKATFESLKPINLIKNTFKTIGNSAELKDSLLNSMMGIGVGYITKRLAFGATHNPIKQIIGTILQFGVSGIISKNGDDIKSGALQLLSRLLKKKTQSEEI